MLSEELKKRNTKLLNVYLQRRIIAMERAYSGVIVAIEHRRKTYPYWFSISNLDSKKRVAKFLQQVAADPSISPSDVIVHEFQVHVRTLLTTEQGMAGAAIAQKDERPDEVQLTEASNRR